MPADGPIPIVLGIDVEPDNRHSAPGAGVEAAGFRRTAAALADLRPRLKEATGRPVRFAWFVRMDPQVAAQGGRAEALLEAAPETVETILEAGDVIGLHTHAGRWDPHRRIWIADHGDPAWIDDCLVASADAYHRQFNRACREHRFGDRFSSAAVFERLADLGVKVDLTPEPGQRGRRRPPHVHYAAGRIPSYLRTPRAAHRVADERLWLLPLSSSDPAPGMPPVRRWVRRLRYLGQPRHRTLVLDRGWPSPEMFWEQVEGQLDQGAAHLALVFRSDLILHPPWEGASRILEALLGRSVVRRLIFVGGEEAVARSVANARTEPAPGSM